MRVARFAGYALLVVLAGLIAVRWAGLDRWTPLIQAMVAIPYLAVGCLIAMVVLFVARRRGLGVVTLIVFVAYFAALLPRWAVPEHDAPDGAGLRVMTANLHDGDADPAALVRLVRQRRPDILAVQELTRRAETALDRAGIGRYLPSRVLRAGPDQTGSGLYSRGALTDGRGLSPDSTFFMARAAMAVADTHLDLVSVHPRPPLTASAAGDWARDLGLLPGAGAPGTQVLVGDFNATDDMSAFRRLIHDDGYHDAAISVGAGLSPTWHRWPIPPVTFDHILLDKRLTATAVHTDDLPGSDHRVLTADLVLTGQRA